MENVELQDIVNAIKGGNYETINEVSLNRVYQHIKKEASDSFAIITAFRAVYSTSINKSRNKKLESDIRSLGLGFFKLIGHWVECQDDTMEYSKCPPELKVDVKEEILFVPNISKKDAVRLTKKYDQDAIIFQGKETDDTVELLSKDGNTIEKLGTFSPGKIARVYTRIKGRTFVFEGFQYKPTSVMENIVFDILSKSK